MHGHTQHQKHEQLAQNIHLRPYVNYNFQCIDFHQTPINQHIFVSISRTEFHTHRMKLYKNKATYHLRL